MTEGWNHSAEGYNICFIGHQHFVYPPVLSALYLIILVVLIALAVIGNGLIIIAVLRERRLHCTQNVLYINLAASDIITGSFVVPPISIFMLHNCFILGERTYRACVAVQSICVTSAYLTICAVAIERFIVVQYPFLSKKCETHLYKMVFIALSWIVPSVTWIPLMTLCEVSPLDGVYVVEIPMIFSYLCTIFVQHIPFIVMIILYVMLILKIKQRFQVQMPAECELSETSTMAKPSTFGLIVRSGKSSRFLALRRQYRAARMLGALIVAFIACWFPWSIVWPVYTARQAHVPTWVVKVTLTLSYLNSAINPFLYAFMSRDFQCAVFRLLCWCRTKHHSLEFNNIVQPRKTVSGENSYSSKRPTSRL